MVKVVEFQRVAIKDQYSDFYIQLNNFKGFFTSCIQPKTKLNNHLGFQFSDFQLRSFVDPKPVELLESAIPVKFSLSLLV